jgi:hypothetical protein
MVSSAGALGGGGVARSMASWSGSGLRLASGWGVGVVVGRGVVVAEALGDGVAVGGGGVRVVCA